MNRYKMLRMAMFLLTVHCNCIYAHDVSDFNGIRLESAEAELSSDYKQLFKATDCKIDSDPLYTTKTCVREIAPERLPGAPHGLKHPVIFSLIYMNDKLWRIGFEISRSDYDTFIKMLNKAYGPPLETILIKRDSLSGNSYTWNKGPHSIATYVFTRDTNRSMIVFTVIYDYMLRIIKK